MRLTMWMRPAACVCALALAGCGSGNGLTIVRVSGTVTYDGKPARLGEVRFIPDSSKGTKGVPSAGAIDQDGRYMMSTQDPGDGAIAGHHLVGIRVLDPEPVGTDQGPEADPEKPTIGDRVARRKSLSQSRRQSRGKAGANTVNVNGGVYRFLTPAKLADPETSGIKIEVSRGSNRVDFAIGPDGEVKVSQ